MKRESIRKSEKIQDFLELHVRKPSRRTYEYHLQEYAIYTDITDFDTYLKDPRKLSKNKKIDYEDQLQKNILKYWKYINEESDKFHGKTSYVFLSVIKRLLAKLDFIRTQEDQFDMLNIF